jgi:hypothetical protein
MAQPKPQLPDTPVHSVKRSFAKPPPTRALLQSLLQCQAQPDFLTFKRNTLTGFSTSVLQNNMQ